MRYRGNGLCVWKVAQLWLQLRAGQFTCIFRALPATWTFCDSRRLCHDRKVHNNFFFIWLRCQNNWLKNIFNNTFLFCLFPLVHVLFWNWIKNLYALACPTCLSGWREGSGVEVRAMWVPRGNRICSVYWSVERLIEIIYYSVYRRAIWLAGNSITIEKASG